MLAQMFYFDFRGFIKHSLHALKENESKVYSCGDCRKVEKIPSPQGSGGKIHISPFAYVKMNYDVFHCG